ncbi:hypothetical protein WMY93_001442 [Mugilogobius chulae]|uniref:Uncharacterized protein n=1 Tax=Mugilogobius chulae TaxID=88201 RepID=A0AAW0Q289_9GOBI
MQAQASLDTSDQPSMNTLLKKIVAKDGFFGLYRGILPNFMKVIPATSLSGCQAGGVKETDLCLSTSDTKQITEFDVL